MTNNYQRPWLLQQLSPFQKRFQKREDERALVGFGVRHRERRRTSITGDLSEVQKHSSFNLRSTYVWDEKRNPPWEFCNNLLLLVTVKYGIWVLTCLHLLLVSRKVIKIQEESLFNMGLLQTYMKFLDTRQLYWTIKDITLAFIMARLNVAKASLIVSPYAGTIPTPLRTNCPDPNQARKKEIILTIEDIHELVQESASHYVLILEPRRRACPVQWSGSCVCIPFVRTL